MKKLGGVDEDEKGIRFSTTKSTRWRSKDKKNIWIGYLFGVMMGGIVDHLRPKRNYSIAMKIISLCS